MRPPRFRTRTLMVAVAAVGVALGAGVTLFRQLSSSSHLLIAARPPSSKTSVKPFLTDLGRAAFGTSSFAYGSAAWGFVTHCSPAADPSQCEPRIGLHRSKRSREQRHTHQERFHRESHGFIPWGLPA